jgi:hypothetical protein
MIQTREQALQSIKQKLATSGRHLWSVDDDQDSTLITVHCYEVNGRQLALQQQFRKTYTGRKVDYQVISGTLFQQADISGRVEDAARQVEQLVSQGQSQQEFSRQPA